MEFTVFSQDTTAYQRRCNHQDREMRKEKQKPSCWVVEQSLPSALLGMEEADYVGTSIS